MLIKWRRCKQTGCSWLQLSPYEGNTDIHRCRVTSRQSNRISSVALQKQMELYCSFNIQADPVWTLTDIPCYLQSSQAELQPDPKQVEQNVDVHCWQTSRGMWDALYNWWKTTAHLLNPTKTKNVKSLFIFHKCPCQAGFMDRMSTVNIPTVERKRERLVPVFRFRFFAFFATNIHKSITLKQIVSNPAAWEETLRCLSFFRAILIWTFSSQSLIQIRNPDIRKAQNS